MVVVVILSLLAAVSTPALHARQPTRARVATGPRSSPRLLQRARFQAMGDRANIHVMLYRTHVDIYREESPRAAPTTTFTLLGSIPGP